MDDTSWRGVGGTFRAANSINRLTREKEKQMAKAVSRRIARAIASGRRPATSRYVADQRKKRRNRIEGHRRAFLRWEERRRAKETVCVELSYDTQHKILLIVGRFIGLSGADARIRVAKKTHLVPAASVGWMRELSERELAEEAIKIIAARKQDERPILGKYVDPLEELKRK